MAVRNSRSERDEGCKESGQPTPSSNAPAVLNSMLKRFRLHLSTAGAFELGVV
jgi:hypothetical protein